MGADLTLLVPDLREKLPRLMDACASRGVTIRPYIGLRTPIEQAKLWRQSRASEAIAQKIVELRQAGANFIADCVEHAGPQNGPHVTNALPGLSWHQWGEAVDSFWLVNGNSEWSTDKLVGGLNGYHVMADEAEKIGLSAGGHWVSFKDWPHVQLRKEASPLDAAMSLVDIDAEMKHRFP
jgi:peptidoglycan LD-endopeptidase CwlK